MINFGSAHDPTSTIQSSRAVTRLFAVLGLKYGHRWISLFPDDEIQNEAQKMWSRELANISFERIGKAVDKLSFEYPSWPPTVGEFKQLCIVGMESEKLSLENKPRSEIDFEKQIALLEKYLPDLKLALRGKYEEG